MCPDNIVVEATRFILDILLWGGVWVGTIKNSVPNEDGTGTGDGFRGALIESLGIMTLSRDYDSFWSCASRFE